MGTPFKIPKKKQPSDSSVIRMTSHQNLLFITLIDEVLMQTVTVEAEVRGSMILPCSFPHYEMDVFWRYEKTETVYDIVEGKVNFQEQDQVYRGRVTGFPSEFTKGNYSIKLKDVNLTDGGIYSCGIPNNTPHYVELKIKEPSIKIQPWIYEKTNGADRRLSHPLMCFSATSVVRERVQRNVFIEHAHFFVNVELNATHFLIKNLNMK